ncbi:CapA family protein [Gordonia sp. ABSL11-1]|uniref:CapA family protein n=1 Tax=Gordonia sp. ABSL11-1 TaxID=3053924 RepID=UPI002573DDF3|nr:CapA family protein [Gordonia sp. ABSL11-1]MDL9946916.1 CapA family protein [Gordonia sp. ABSL11-1]
MTKDERRGRRVWRWVLPTVATAAVLATAATVAVHLPDHSVQADVDRATTARGTVVDETGTPVAGASIRVGSTVVHSGDDGGFTLPVPIAALASAEAAGHLPRTQAVAPGDQVRMELTSRAAESTALRFGGDVMFGRGFYERSGAHPPRLGPRADAAAHADLLSGVAPLLQDSDLTVVNLESPLIDRPYFPENRPRPKRFHPTKKTAVASATEAAEAMRMSGVKVASLANDHMLDALRPGLDSTLSALDKAGIAHFGAGRDEDEAWAPKIVPQRRGGAVAFVGCTTVDGEKNPIPYVADDDRAGAAECTTKRIRRAVAQAKQRAETVVVMIHGGHQDQREQSPTVRRMSDAAARAGASVVVGSHPRVVGGVRTVNGSVIAESTGDLLYDRPRWTSAPTQLLRVDIRRGQPVYTGSDPVMLEESRPVPVTAALADSVSRITAGTVEGSAHLSATGVEMGARSGPPVRQTGVALPAGAVRRLSTGWFLGTAPTGVRVGNDLLWGSGRFEDQDTDPMAKGVNLWELGRAARTTVTAACTDSRDRDIENDGSPEGKGLELVRGPKSTMDVFATPGRRIGVAPGQRVSLLADVRSASPGSTLEIRWYSGFRGRSMATTTTAVPEGDRSRNGCLPVRLDATAPPGAVAAQPYVRLRPPDDSLSGPRLAVDDVRLVDWAPERAAGRRFDTVEATRPVTVRVSSDRADDSGPFVGNGAGDR